MSSASPPGHAANATGAAGACSAKRPAGRRLEMPASRRREGASVTALTAEAGSFSGRLGGLTRAQPGPGVNVARPVHIGVHRAVHGADHGVLSWPGAPSPALVAAGAGAGRVHPDQA